MLDAFQHSAREDQAKKAHGHQAQSPTASGSGKGAEQAEPKVDPPLEARARAAPAKPSAPRSAPRPEDLARDDVLGSGARGRWPRHAMRVPRWLPPAGVVLLLAMAGTWWIGRLLSNSGETHAQPKNNADLLESFENDLAGPAGVGPGNTPNLPEAPPIADDQNLTEDDRRFIDPKNLFTVRAIYFNNDSRGWQRAIATYHHLRASGLPAIAPITQEKILVLCVGAEPTMNQELTQIQTKLRALPGPPPQYEPDAFADAFFVNIDDYLDR